MSRRARNQRLRPSSRLSSPIRPPHRSPRSRPALPVSVRAASCSRVKRQNLPPPLRQRGSGKEDRATANVRVDGAPAEATIGGGELRWRRLADRGGGAEPVAGARRARGRGEGEGRHRQSLRGGGRHKHDVVRSGCWREGSWEAAVQAGLRARDGRRRGRRRGVGREADTPPRLVRLINEMEINACMLITPVLNFSPTDRPKRLFVFVNPFGGRKCAKKIYDTEIKPLFEAAEAEYQGHAREVASSLDLAKYDGIVCVSGDGILVEVVNGILQRTDWEEVKKMPIGVVPAGSGNGMAKSLLHAASETCSVSNAVFAIIKGHKQSLDVCTILQGEKKFFSVLLMTWGLVADIDIESEKYRWMGSARFDFYAVVRIMNSRKYCGSIQFVPAPGYEAYGEPVKQVENCILESLEQNGKSHVSSYPGPSAEFQASDWRFVDGPFVAVWINNVPWAAEDIMAAPEAKFSDGYMDAVILRYCPKADLLALLTKMGDGSYVKSPYVTYLKVRSFKLSPGPLVGNLKKGGIIDVDGEVVARGEGTYGGSQYQDVMAYGPPIQLTVHQALASTPSVLTYWSFWQI